MSLIFRQGIRLTIALAVRSAENVDYSTRYKLYDLYIDIMQDTHLTSVIEKRVQAVLSTKVVFSRNGKPDDRVNEQIRSPWFTRLVEDILAAKWWGFSLMQFYKDGEWLDYNLIPRKHVDPIKKLILRRQSDITGIGWEEYRDLLFVGSKDDLGLLFKAAPWVIYKRNNVADWAQYSEIFGMPIREYIYDSDDNEARQRAYEDSRNSGSLATFIHAKDTELLLKEAGNKSGSAELYERFCERCNSEVSKLILGNTLTTEASSTGTQALGTVHKKVEDIVTQSDKRYVADVLNYDMSDIFLAMGVDTAGGEFSFSEPKDMDQTKRAGVLKILKNDLALPISDDQIYDEFGIEKPSDYDAQKAAAVKTSPKEYPEPAPEDKQEGEPVEDTKDQKKQKKGLFNTIKDFFFRASIDDEAHLNW
ncbi:MAG: DUF935 family protein [Rikenellaceae bacterium]